MDANDQIKSGEALLSASDFPAAIKVFREVIATLGDHYYSSDTLDDSGLALGLASTEERNGRLSVAAHLLRGVAASRLAMYERKNRLAG